MLVIVIFGIWFWSSKKTQNLSLITSFAECEKAQYPIQEISPRRCVLPDGRVYVEEVIIQPKYDNATANDIQVELPYPGAVTGKTFSVIGKARGYWYFEASFPVQFLDQNGKSLAVGVAQSQGDWMTREFVPFKADLTIPQDYIGPGTLILHKDNPSGLPENDASISFPITVEY